MPQRSADFVLGVDLGKSISDDEHSSGEGDLRRGCQRVGCDRATTHGIFGRDSASKRSAFIGGSGEKSFEKDRPTWRNQVVIRFFQRLSHLRLISFVGRRRDRYCPTNTLGSLICSPIAPIRLTQRLAGRLWRQWSESANHLSSRPSPAARTVRSDRPSCNCREKSRSASSAAVFPFRTTVRIALFPEKVPWRTRCRSFSRAFLRGSGPLGGKSLMVDLGRHHLDFHGA